MQARRWALEHRFHSLIVVTSAYHMPRALAELSHQLPDVTLIPFPVVSDRLRIEPWWSNGATTRLVLSEYLKYLAAKVRMRFDSFAETSELPARCRVSRLNPKIGTAASETSRQVLRVPHRSRFSPVRSLFNALFYANLTVHLIVALPTLVLPYPALRVFIRSYARTSLWLLRVVCGTKVEWRGAEKIPKGACIVACKHQSAWETFALYAVLDDPVYVLKRELMWIPLFGWYMRKAGLIPIDRSAGMAALARMTARAQKALAGARAAQLIIFPEGTRRPPGAEPDYKPGIVYLYGKAGVPCVPMALNSGLYWPRRSLLPPARHHRRRSSRSDRARSRQGHLLRPAAGQHRDGERALAAGIGKQVAKLARLLTLAA